MGGAMSQSWGKQIDILSSTTYVEFMHFIQLAKKISMFLKALIGYKKLTNHNLLT